MDDFNQIIDEYPLNYCQQLELAYGSGMMSEGGTEAIDTLFSQIDIQNKSIYEIGCGLGGMAYYLASTHQPKAFIASDINNKLISYCKNKWPKLTNLHFQYADKPNQINFKSNHFDIVTSKGVLVHLHNKRPLYQEIYRVLKPNGVFVLNDWLSKTPDTFGDALDKMAKTEGLSLFPTTKTHYLDLLKSIGFTQLKVVDQTKQYAKYNFEIVKHLASENIMCEFIERFGKQTYTEIKQGYQLTATAMNQGDVIVKNIYAFKA
ncbi:methyltransferase domain-containing protein [Thiotrichales bacterium 19S3-7]|nr:methyltransferase domain-containing protein [Thiotrichales bacterium 19S3-7]MCF6800996.1 methyltransferase domain-containing protein [Thiotrichales bacterium 19S3-11]